MTYTHLMQEQRCPKCGYKLTASTSLESPEAPEPGDFTVCIKCATPLRFRGGMRPALLTPADERELEEEGLKPQIDRIQKAIRQMRASAN